MMHTSRKLLPKLPKSILDKHPNGDGIALLEDLKICHKGPSLEKLTIKQCQKYCNHWSVTELRCLIDSEGNQTILAQFPHYRQLFCEYIG